MHILGTVGTGLGVLVIVLACIVAVILSCVSISGTWVILGAALGAMLLRGDSGFPGWITIVVFLLLSIAIEVAEAFASSWGVAKRGGSKLAGFAALIGGLLGLGIGSYIPIPIVGSLLGMLVFSFGATFGVEQWRLKHMGQAAHIARGAVWARVLIVVLKVVFTLGMMAFLLGGMAIAWIG